MKDITLPISEFKAKCLRLIEDVETKGDRIVITKRGRPVAEVHPVAQPKPLRGSWKGKVEIKGDIVYFGEDEWEAERE